MRFIIFEVSCICQVPLLPPAISGSTGEAPPFLFKLGQLAQNVKEAGEKLQCRVSGAMWLKKLSQPSGTMQSASAAKKRAKAPDLSEKEQPAKKARAQPKSKAAGAAKPKAKAKTSSRPTSLQEGESIVSNDVEYYRDDSSSGALPSGTRQRMWLDDLLAAIVAVLKASQLRQGAGGSLDVAIDKYGSSPKAKLIAMTISFGLRFALEGRVKINGKTFKEWSKARPALQNFLRSALDKLSSEERESLPTSASVPDMLNNLVQEVSKGESNDSPLASLSSPAMTKQSALSLAKGIVGDKQAMVEVGKFLEQNNSLLCQNHPAFQRMLKTFREAMCSCAQGPGCDFHNHAHTLSDFLWGLHRSYQIMDGGVPAHASFAGSACLVANGCILAIIDHKTKKIPNSPSRKQEQDLSAEDCGRTSEIKRLGLIFGACV